MPRQIYMAYQTALGFPEPSGKPKMVKYRFQLHRYVPKFIS